MKMDQYGLTAVMIAISLMTVGCGAKAMVSETKSVAESGAIETEATEAGAGIEAAKTGAAKAGEADTGKAKTEKADLRGGKEEKEVKDAMVPVYGEEIKDGVYSVKVDSSSNMFRVTRCELTVKEGTMSAVMTMGGTGYLSLYMGTGEEALKASDSRYISYVEREDGTHTFEIPVEALDKEIYCSAFSRKKEKWYDRTLVFQAASLPSDAFAGGKNVTALSLMLKDGWYTANVALEGGSGRAAVESPARLWVEDGKIRATIVWGSSNYDYMKVDGQRFELASGEGNSTFEIPVSGFDRKIPVIADTIAMSEPHEIEYTLTFDSKTLKKAE